MAELLRSVQELCEAVVFGNGWLALGGVVVVTGATAAIRLSRGVRV